MPQFNVVCHREVDPLPRNKAKISLRISATDGKTISTSPTSRSRCMRGSSTCRVGS